MINLFRNLNPANLFVAAIVAFILRLGLLYQLPDSLAINVVESFTLLLIKSPLNESLSPVNNVILSAIITIIQAILFNRTINNYNLLGKQTFLPALIYITISCLFTPFLVLSPPLICNFFSIWMMSKFLSIYNQDSATSIMYDLGMIVAAGTLVYFPFISMVPILWISLFVFRPFYWREWIAVLMGFITIYFFLGVYYYWNNSLGSFYQIWLPLVNKFPSALKINYYDYIVLGPVLLLLILSILSLQKGFFRSFVQIRKSFQLLGFMFMLAIISFYLKPEFRINHFLLAVAPTSVFIAYYFLNAKKRWFYESLYVVLVGFIIYFQIY